MKKSFLLFLLVIFCFTWWLPHTDADTQEIKDLMSAYATADHQGRLDIIHKLGKFGPEADSWLVEILYVEGSRHLLNTATVLVENRIKNKRELLDKIILRTLTDPDSVYRNAGARALAYFEVNRDYIDTRLINAALTDVNGDIRQNAAVAIGNSPPTARKAVALFRRHLKNDRLMIGYPAQHRVNAIDAMGYMGEYAKDAALDLLHPAILEDPIINSAPMIIETFMRLSSNGKKALPKLIELYDKNNSSLSKEDILNIFSEMFNPQSPLSPRIKEIIPTIIKEFDDPNSYHLPEVLNLLSQFKSDPAVIDVLPKIANKTLHEDDPLIRSKAIILFDDIMSSLSSKEINKLNPEIKKQMYLFKHQTNECKILCSLVDNVDKWSHESYETPDHNFVPDSWGFAIESLGALYMSKVSPFCKAADEMVDQVILEQVEGSEKAQVCRPKKFPFKSLTKLYRDTFDIYLSPQTSPDVYGKQFFTLLMRGV
jgi:hypothetical protein